MFKYWAGSRGHLIDLMLRSGTTFLSHPARKYPSLFRIRINIKFDVKLRAPGVQDCARGVSILRGYFPRYSPLYHYPAHTFT